ncbi:Iron-containing alcohol dehydrogenase [Elusimicrobium minutum Pei191]|uniref:Iron-containing alcohol dehydrogenase n=1 Tax=Elusimicrobium minutum (strain Pei191) TaxID=445932 RepID=B2KBK4_ELUMP|nr:iron-containing alcohol dehydrogenase [Elusimicrobium minutum]ACC98026.1 Iron-containing alcohol dehydrogenase [Elusimicrobium minutum Pei191]
MNNFRFYSPTEIIFGRGVQKETGKNIKKYSSKILFHYGGGSIKKSGLYEEIITSLKEAGVDFVELGGVQPNPRLSLVREGIKLCREHDIGFILAAGGGSVIDSAKAIAMGVGYEGDVWDFFMRKTTLTKSLPVAAVLTIPAAGSESSQGTVITNEETQMKIGFNSPLLRPVFSILNPELCFTLPQNQMAYGVCDMMAHIFERYFTNVKNNDLTDNLCEATLKAIIKNAPKLLKDNKDYNVWAEIMFSGNLAHNGLLGMGREEDWASHAIEHSLSAVYDIAHGAGLAIIFPAWMKYVYKHNTGLFAQFAVNVWGEKPEDTEETLAVKGIKRTEEFFKSLGLPTRIKDILNPTEQDLLLMSGKATAFGSLGNFIKLDANAVLDVYKLAL